MFQWLFFHEHIDTGGDVGGSESERIYAGNTTLATNFVTDSRKKIKFNFGIIYEGWIRKSRTFNDELTTLDIILQRAIMKNEEVSNEQINRLRVGCR